MLKVSLFFAAVMLLFAGCNTPGSCAVGMKGKDSYYVTLIGDIHYDGPEYHIEPKSEKSAKLHYGQWQQGVSQQLLAAAAKESKDTAPFVVQLGDLINGDCDNAERQGAAIKGAYKILKKFFPGKMVLTIEGNHEHRGKQDASQAPDKYLVPLIKKELGRDIPMDGTNYAVCYGKDLYIFYDYRKKNSGEFVKKTISEYGNARHIFFLTHIPMFPCSIGNPGWVVPQFKELIPLLARHKAVVISAHAHSMNHIVYKCSEGELAQLTVTSMGREWLKGSISNVRYNSYDAWKNNIKPHYFTNPRYKWSVENLRYFRNEDFLTYRVGYLEPSGFAKLEINGDKVTAHIFTDDSGKPKESWVLKEN